MKLQLQGLFATGFGGLETNISVQLQQAIDAFKDAVGKKAEQDEKMLEMLKSIRDARVTELKDKVAKNTEVLEGLKSDVRTFEKDIKALSKEIKTLEDKSGLSDEEQKQLEEKQEKLEAKKAKLEKAKGEEKEAQKVIDESNSEIEKLNGLELSINDPKTIGILLGGGDHKYKPEKNKRELRKMRFVSIPGGGYNASCQTKAQVYSAILMLDKKDMKVKVDISKDMDESKQVEHLEAAQAAYENMSKEGKENMVVVFKGESYEGGNILTLEPSPATMVSENPDAKPVGGNTPDGVNNKVGASDANDEADYDEADDTSGRDVYMNVNPAPGMELSADGGSFFSTEDLYDLSGGNNGSDLYVDMSGKVEVNPELVGSAKTTATDTRLMGQHELQHAAANAALTSSNPNNVTDLDSAPSNAPR